MNADEIQKLASVLAAGGATMVDGAALVILVDRTATNFRLAGAGFKDDAGLDNLLDTVKRTIRKQREEALRAKERMN